MQKPILGLDVDLTVAPLDKMWFEWLTCMCGPAKIEFIEGVQEFYEDYNDFYNAFVRYGQQINYNLTVYFEKPINKNVDWFDFFRREGIYDTVRPYYGSQVTLKTLQKHFDIVFISHIKGNHHKSKYNFLARNFKNFDFLATKEKHRVTMDILVDDRINFLNKVGEYGVSGIHVDTIYTQDEEPAYTYPKVNLKSLDGWDQLISIVDETMKSRR